MTVLTLQLRTPISLAKLSQSPLFRMTHSAHAQRTACRAPGRLATPNTQPHASRLTTTTSSAAQPTKDSLLCNLSGLPGCEWQFPYLEHQRDNGHTYFTGVTFSMTPAMASPTGSVALSPGLSQNSSLCILSTHCSDLVHTQP